PFVRGPLPTRLLTQRAKELGGEIGTWLDEIGDISIAGLLAVAFGVDRRGKVGRVHVLSDTTRVPKLEEKARQQLLRKVQSAIGAWTFGAQKAPSAVTLPLVFERG
ncbi:MAG TPA: hypothetical protein VL326_02980, partial [Kofleriaceae bacterium]|nr:hypothetical protein [Kofleriaceae bacterium]